MVRAKFRPPQTPVDTEEVKLSAVMGDENKEWSQWTPCGQLSMTITNKDAIAQFEVGKDYFLDFTPAT